MSVVRASHSCHSAKTEQTLEIVKFWILNHYTKKNETYRIFRFVQQFITFIEFNSELFAEFPLKKEDILENKSVQVVKLNPVIHQR
jgi:hypothetical protein